VFTFCICESNPDEVYEWLGQVSGNTLKRAGGFPNFMVFRDVKPPPNMRLKSAHDDYSKHHPACRKDDVFEKSFIPVVLRKKEDFAAVLKRAKKEDFIAIDTETTGIDKFSECLVGVSFCLGDGFSYYVPVGHDKDSVSWNVAAGFLRELLLLKCVKFFHNLTYDLAIFNRHGFEVDDNCFDSQIAVHSVDSDKTMVSLGTLSKEYFGYVMQPITALIGKRSRKQPQLLFSAVPVEDAAFYAGEDAVVTYFVGRALYDVVFGSSVEGSFEKDMLLIPVIIKMMSHGVVFDCKKAEKLSFEFGCRMEALRSVIFDFVGEEFNLNSSKQIARILFEDMSLPVMVSYFCVDVFN